MIIIILFFQSNMAYLTQKLGPLKTSLSAGSLLTLAGLTITFYVLLEHIIEREWGKQDRYVHIKDSVSNLIITNIFIVSLAIIIIMVSTVGMESFKMAGFNLLFVSWTFNLVIMVYLFSYPIIESALSRKWQRILINLLYTIIIIFCLINYFLKY